MKYLKSINHFKFSQITIYYCHYFGVFMSYVRQGDSPSGSVILTISGKLVRKGNTTSGSALFYIDGDKIRQGESPSGTVVANVSGKYIRKGSSPSGVLATIDGNKVRKGDSPTGTVIATTDGGPLAAAAAAAFLLLSIKCLAKHESFVILFIYRRVIYGASNQISKLMRDLHTLVRK
jgi:DNA-binding beta-propeller fold protein YncE